MNLENRLSSALWDAIRLGFQGGNYTAAIQDGMYYLSDLIREKSGLEGDGSPLVGQAFGGSTPLIKVNSLQSESDWNVQKGIEQILRGLYQAIRNPRSHGKVVDSEADAQTIILFIDYVARVIGASRTPFSLADHIVQVLDRDFVGTKRYASLLVEKLPAKYRLEVFYEIFNRRNEAKTDSLRLYFQALWDVLSEDEKKAVARAVSAELEHATDEGAIRTVVGSIGPIVWRDLDELARLRIEHKLVESLRGGSYNKARERCDSGSLGTWMQSVLEHISDPAGLLVTLTKKLESNDEGEREYVYRFFMGSLDTLSPVPTERLKALIRKRLNDGDLRFKEAFDAGWLWVDYEWPPDISEALANFKPIAPFQSPFDADDDDLPF